MGAKSARTLRLADEDALREMAARTRGVASYAGSTLNTIGPVPPALVSAPAKTARCTIGPLKMSEDDLQMACFELMEAMRGKHPILEWVVHVPNGGLRHRATAGRLKAMGVKKGVLDIILPLPYNGWSGMAIELKVGRNTTTAEQDDWLTVLASGGYYTAVAYSLDEFEHHLKSFLSQPAPHSPEDASTSLIGFLQQRRSGR